MIAVAAIVLVLFRVSFHVCAEFALVGAQALPLPHTRTSAGAFKMLTEKRRVEKLRVAEGMDTDSERVSSISGNHPRRFNGSYMKDLTYPFETYLPFNLRTDVQENLELTADKYAADVVGDHAFSETYRSSASLPGLPLQENADASHSTGGSPRQLFSSLGIPAVKPFWLRFGYTVTQPRYNWQAYRNSIPHSYPTPEEIQTFLGKIQGLHPLIPGPWQNVQIITSEETYAVISPQGAALAVLLRNFEEFWEEIVGKAAIFHVVLNEPLEKALIAVLRVHEEFLYQLFWYFVRLYPIEPLRLTLPQQSNS